MNIFTKTNVKIALLVTVICYAPHVLAKQTCVDPGPKKDLNTITLKQLEKWYQQREEFLNCWKSNVDEYTRNANRPAEEKWKAENAKVNSNYGKTYEKLMTLKMAVERFSQQAEAAFVEVGRLIKRINGRTKRCSEQRDAEIAKIVQAVGSENLPLDEAARISVRFPEIIGQELRSMDYVLSKSRMLVGVIENFAKPIHVAHAACGDDCTKAGIDEPKPYQDSVTALTTAADAAASRRDKIEKFAVTVTREIESRTRSIIMLNKSNLAADAIKSAEHQSASTSFISDLNKAASGAFSTTEQLIPKFYPRVKSLRSFVALREICSVTPRLAWAVSGCQLHAANFAKADRQLAQTVAEDIRFLVAMLLPDADSSQKDLLQNIEKLTQEGDIENAARRLDSYTSSLDINPVTP